ncbi:MAG: hypothetical protein WCF93_03515 [Candidatus Moraniibacteriota bacterium]
MNLGFPTRFLKKLDIYQQIRSGQGLSKHKDLWKYEAAFLMVAYGKGHQFLNACPNKKMIIDWIKDVYPKYSETVDDQIIGNLMWRGYLVRNNENSYNITEKGLLVGEVLSEIENKKWLLKMWNKYRYNFVIDMFWLLIFLSLMNIFFGESLSKFSEDVRRINIKFCCFDFGHNILIAFLVFILWPFLNLLYRKVYLFIESWE